MPTIWDKQNEAIAKLGKHATFREAVNAGIMTQEEALQLVKEANPPTSIHFTPTPTHTSFWFWFTLGLFSNIGASQ